MSLIYDAIRGVNSILTGALSICDSNEFISKLRKNSHNFGKRNQYIKKNSIRIDIPLEIVTKKM